MSVVLLGLTLLPVPARGLGAQPDLVVAEARLSAVGLGAFWSTRFVGAVTFRWRHRTENAGTAPARPSTTAVWFSRGSGGQSGIEDPSRVPKLEPNGVFLDRGSFEVNFREVRYGSIPTKVCADSLHQVAESLEGNNCEKLRTYYLVPYVLEGKIQGIVTTHPSPTRTTTVSWEGTLSFDISDGAPDGNKGIFDYRYYRGTLTFTLSQTDSATGCSASGTGQYTPTSTDGFKLRFGKDPRYTVLGGVVPPDYHFPVTITCPSAPPVPIEWYAAGPWIRIGPTEKSFPDPGLQRIRGTYTNPDPNFPVQYSWNLGADG
jgi:hypothetical protein